MHQVTGLHLTGVTTGVVVHLIKNDDQVKSNFHQKLYFIGHLCTVKVLKFNNTISMGQRQAKQSHHYIQLPQHGLAQFIFDS